MIQDINLGVLNFSFIFFSSHSFLFSLFTLYLLVIVALNIIDWFQSITSLFEEAFFLGFYFWKEWGQGFHLFYIIFYLIIFCQFFFKILILYFIFIINIYFILARIQDIFNLIAVYIIFLVNILIFYRLSRIFRISIVNIMIIIL